MTLITKTITMGFALSFLVASTKCSGDLVLAIESDITAANGTHAYCKPVLLPENRTFYAVEAWVTQSFRPDNHIDIDACDKAVSFGPDTELPPDRVFDCTEKRSAVCGIEPRHMWSLPTADPNSRHQRLAPGVGFRVGSPVGIPYLLLGFHEKSVRHQDRDNVTVHIRLLEAKDGEGLRALSVISLVGKAVVPPHTKREVQAFAVLPYNSTISLLDFQMHTHLSAAKVWLVTRDRQWILIGRTTANDTNDQRDTFHPLWHPGLVARTGDRIASVCHVDNKSDDPLVVDWSGSSDIEMCHATVRYVSAGGREPVVQGFEKTWTDDPVLSSWKSIS